MIRDQVLIGAGFIVGFGFMLGYAIAWRQRGEWDARPSAGEKPEQPWPRR